MKITNGKKLLLIAVAVVIALPLARLGIELVRTGHAWHLVSKPTFDGKVSDPVMLANLVSSYSSPAEVTQLLKLKEGDYELKTEIEYPSIEGKRSGFREAVLRLKSAQQEFLFFNERLYAVRQYGAQLTKVPEKSGERFLEIRKDSEQGSHFIEWSDTRLNNEMTLWTDIYS